MYGVGLARGTLNLRWNLFISMMHRSSHKFDPPTHPPTHPPLWYSQAVGAHLRKSFKAGRVLMSVAPFAMVTNAASSNTFVLVTRAVGSFIKLYLLLLFIRVLLSWFPKFTWDVQPWLALRQASLNP